MNFKSNVFSLIPQMPQKVNPVGEKLPSNRDVCFRSKQNEIVTNMGQHAFLCIGRRGLTGIMSSII